MSLKDVADRLGPPYYWTTIYDNCPVPCFWGYRQLEMRFSDRAPHRLVWFQLSRAGELRGKSVALTAKLRLSLDGLHGAIKPSDFLFSNLWPREKVAIDIQLVADELQLRLSVRPIQLLYTVVEDDTADLDGLIDAFHRQDWHVLTAAFEQSARLHSIGCHSSAEWRHRHWNAPLIKTGARAYLECAAEIAGARAFHE
jgi:hypothetical protein